MFVHKRGFLFKVKACEKNSRRHMVNIPRIIFNYNDEIGQEDHLLNQQKKADANDNYNWEYATGRWERALGMLDSNKFPKWLEDAGR